MDKRAMIPQGFNTTYSTALYKQTVIIRVNFVVLNKLWVVERGGRFGL